MHQTRPAALLVMSAVGLAAFVALSRVVRRHPNPQAGPERALRDAVQDGRNSSGDLAATAVGPLGKEWLHLPAAVALGVWLRSQGRGRVAVVPAVASVAAEITSRTFDRVGPYRRPPPGHPHPDKPSYPSGHALETSAVALTSAYLLAREDLVPAPWAFTTAAVVAVASPLGRIYLDRHWASDAAGGWLLGVSISAAAAALYEVLAFRPAAGSSPSGGPWPARR